MRALRRGLSHEPGDRFPTMDALLAALAPRTRRRVALAAAATSLALLGGAAIALGRDDEPARCTGGPDELAGVWTPPRRLAIAGAFAATGSAMARAAFEQLAADIDRYADAWRSQLAAACEATRIRGDQTEQAMELRVHCLHQRRAELDALLGVLGRANATLVGQSHEVVARLANPVICDDVDALAASKLPVDPQKRASVLALETRLATADAELAAYHFDAATAVARSVLAEAEQAGHKPFVAQTLLLLATIAEAALQPQATEQHLLAVVEVADQAGDDRIRATAYVRLVSVATNANKLDDAERWVRRARATIERLGSDAYLLADLEGRAVQILVARGDRAGAEAGFARVIERLGALYGPRSKEVGRARVDLAVFLSAGRDFERAYTEFDRAREAFADAFGERSPQVGGALSQMAFMRFRQQRIQESFELGQRGLAISEAHFGTDNPILRSVYELHAYTVQASGRSDEAIALQRRLVTFAAAAGERDPQHAAMLGTLGYLEIRAGRYADAVVDLEHSRTIYRALNDEISVAATGDAVAIALQKQGKYDAALALLDEGRSSLVRLGRTSTTEMADTLTRIGAVHVDRKTPADGVGPLEQALAIRRTAADASSSSWTKYELARALWDAGLDRARARAVAGEAEAEATSSGDREQLAKIVAWRQRHR
jgi:eukaryotic-like serine/threonine-protein kinase